MSLAGSVTLGKSLPLSETQLPHLSNRDHSTSWAFMRIKCLIDAKGFEQGLAEVSTPEVSAVISTEAAFA